MYRKKQMVMMLGVLFLCSSALTGGAVFAAEVQGRVELPDGTAVQGATVYAYLEDWMDSEDATTDQDGIFQMDLSGETWTFYADPPEGNTDYAEYNSSMHVTITIESDDSSGELEEPLLLRFRNVRGIVQMPDDTPVAQATVSAHRDEWVETISAITDQDGNFQMGLDEGDWIFHAEPPEENQAYNNYASSSPVTVTITSTVSRTDMDNPLTLTLKNVQGKVTQPDGTPVRDSYVHAYIRDGEGYVGDSSDENGNFMLAMGLGLWVIEAFPPEENSEYSSYDQSQEVLVEITDINAPVDLSTLALRSNNLTGRVVWPDGSGAPDVYVEANTHDYGELVGTETDENGDFGMSLSEGAWTIIAVPPYGEEYAGYIPAQSSVSITNVSSSVSLDEPMTLRKFGTVSGKVVLPDGSPVPEVFVSAESGFEYADTESDDNGDFTLSGLNDGEWTIVAIPPEGNNYAEYHKSDPLTVTVSSENDHVTDQTIALKEGKKTISGTVKDADGNGVSGIEITTVNWEEYEFREVVSGENGEFEISVDAGTWNTEVVQTEGADWISPEPQLSVFEKSDMEERETLTFTLARADAYLKGRLTYPDGNPMTSDETDGTYNESVGIEILNTGTGFFRRISPKSDGSFLFPMLSGTYDVAIWTDPEKYPEYAGPSYPALTLAEETTDLGDIRLIRRNATLHGSVTDMNSDGVPGIHIGIWQPDNWGLHFETETDSKGEFEIKVAPGIWVTEPWVNPDEFNRLYIGSDRETEVMENESKTLRPFILENVSGVIEGTVKDQDGNILENLPAWVYVREATEQEDARPVNETWVENGTFRLLVPRGKMQVGLYLEPESGYVFAEEKLVEIAKRKSEIRASGGQMSMAHSAITEMHPYEKSVQAGTRNGVHKIEFKLRKNDAFIEGTLKTPGGETALISGEVFASPEGSRDIWQWGEISDGTFRIPVSEGTWHLSYELWTEEYMSAPREAIQIKVPAEQTVSQEIVLLPLGKDINGKVQTPDGKGAINVQVWARVYAKGEGEPKIIFEIPVFTDDSGRFNLSLPEEKALKKGEKSVQEYYVCLWTAVQLCGSGNVYCYREAVTDCQTTYLGSSSSKDSEDILLKLRDAKEFLEGKVVAEDEETPVENASVFAYSADGQKAQGTTDSSGAYKLQVAKAESDEGNVWALSAAHKPVGGDDYYRSIELSHDISEMSGSSSQVPDLTLKNMGVLPASETHGFHVERSWTSTLADGGQIHVPANAMPVGKKEKEVTIIIEPRVGGLPDNLEYRTVGYGYAITAREKASGKEINDKFNKEVLLTFRYTDEQLAGLGISEGDIRPAFFSGTSDAWHPMGSFTIDTKNNKVSFPTDHFSIWSLVAVKTVKSAEAVTAVAGDINNDQTVAGLDDAILALRVCADATSAQTAYKEADISGDGKIGLEEVVHILKQLAGLN